MKADTKLLYERGIRVTQDAFEFLEANEISEETYGRILDCTSVFVTRELVNTFITEEQKLPRQVEISRPAAFRPNAKEHPPRFKIIGESDITGKSNCCGKLEDFVAHFRDRFERISKILRTRICPHPLVATNKLKESGGTKVRLIAMVTDKRNTKKGNILLDVEDEEGCAKAVVTRDKGEAFALAQKILIDDVVALDGKNAEELFICDGITWPDIPFAKEQKKTEDDIAIAYLSDIHIGSKKFLEREFSHFLNWLNGGEGDARQRELAGKVKYIIFCGDIVDGIGIYPEQERELAEKDIFKQYAMLDRALEKIPDYITVFVAPGNHDAVRRAEPQPSIPFDLMHSEVVRIGSPSNIEIEGLKHLVYHGASLDSIISGAGLKNGYANPHEAMLELIRRRHLSPIYGDNLIVPEARDYLLIEDEPDIVHMGHVHTNGYMLYRGTLLVNSGTFQDRTDFQVRMGHVPTPAIVPILEGKTGKLNHMGFAGDSPVAGLER